MKNIKLSLFAVLLAIGSISLTAFKPYSDPVDFTGEWILIIEKSELGNASIPRSGKSSFKIIQQTPVIIMEKSFTDSTGNVHSAFDTIAFDGKVKKLNAGNGQFVQRSITKAWSADQQVMTLLSKFLADNNGEPVEFTGTETWSLTNGGKTLTIVNETVLPDRTEKAKLVYTRK